MAKNNKLNELLKTLYNVFTFLSTMSTMKCNNVVPRTELDLVSASLLSDDKRKPHALPLAPLFI